MKFCWHRWTKWKVVAEGFLQAEYDALTGRHFDEHEKFITSNFIRQQRECEKCGKILLRRVTA